MEIDLTDNVISLEAARHRFDMGKCSHNKILVDDRLNTVECKKCGEKLNPIWVLMKFVTEETQWERNLELLKQQREMLDKRKRTKCQHCKKMTTIRIK